MTTLQNSHLLVKFAPMKQIKFLCVLLALISAAALAQQSTESSSSESAVVAPEPATTKVIMQTALGSITLAIETERAPVTASNFLHYVDQKRFDGIGFYRAVKIGETGNYGLVQAGLRGDPKKEFKPIRHEPTFLTGLSHVSGAISMARLASGSAASDFFIVLGDLPALDAQPGASGDNQGYAVFGHVVDGMEVVRAILEQPHSLTAGEGAMQGQMLATPVKIQTVRRAN
jgi:peptidyl-prolyl cis-trans isomerase A (cyclophilin A)